MDFSLYYRPFSVYLARSKGFVSFSKYDLLAIDTDSMNFFKQKNIHYSYSQNCIRIGRLLSLGCYTLSSNIKTPKSDKTSKPIMRPRQCNIP